MEALTKLLQMTEKALEMNAEVGVTAHASCLAVLAIIRNLAQNQYEKTLWQEKSGAQRDAHLVDCRLCFIDVKVECHFDPKHPPSQVDVRARLQRVQETLTLTIEHIRAHRTE